VGLSHPLLHAGLSRRFPTLPLDTSTPSFFISPTMRKYPHDGFSFANRRTSSTVSSGNGGRPGFLDLRAQ
jgi:hypothetical protein